MSTHSFNLENINRNILAKRHLQLNNTAWFCLTDFIIPFIHTGGIILFPSVYDLVILPFTVKPFKSLFQYEQCKLHHYLSDVSANDGLQVHVMSLLYGC